MKVNFFYNFWAKIVTLILAIATWFYVFDMVNQDYTFEQTLFRPAAEPEFTLKKIVVEPSFTGAPPRGYRARLDEVRVDPQHVHVLAPVTMIRRIDAIRTERIDLRKVTKSTKFSVGLTTDLDMLTLPEEKVEVYVPVSRVDD